MILHFDDLHPRAGESGKAGQGFKSRTGERRMEEHSSHVVFNVYFKVYC